MQKALTFLEYRLIFQPFAFFRRHSKAEVVLLLVGFLDDLELGQRSQRPQFLIEFLKPTPQTMIIDVQAQSTWQKPSYTGEHAD